MAGRLLGCEPRQEVVGVAAAVEPQRPPRQPCVVRSAQLGRVGIMGVLVSSSFLPQDFGSFGWKKQFQT